MTKSNLILGVEPAPMEQAPHLTTQYRGQQNPYTDLYLLEKPKSPSTRLQQIILRMNQYNDEMLKLVDNDIADLVTNTELHRNLYWLPIMLSQHASDPKKINKAIAAIKDLLDG